MKKFKKFVTNEKQLKFIAYLNNESILSYMKELAVALVDKQKLSIQDYNSLVSFDQISFISMQMIRFSETEFKSVGSYFGDYISKQKSVDELTDIQLNNIYWILETLRTSKRKVYHTISYLHVSEDDGYSIYEIVGNKLDFYTKLGYTIVECKEELKDDYKLYKAITDSIGLDISDLDVSSNETDIDHMENLLRGNFNNEPENPEE